MPLVPAHLKRKLAKKSKNNANGENLNGNDPTEEDDLGIMNSSVSSLINEIREVPTEEVKKEGSAKLAAAAATANAYDVSVNFDGMIPAEVDVDSEISRPPVPETVTELAPPAMMVSSSSSAQRLVSKRNLLYPMHGVTAYENNDGMKASEEVEKEEAAPAATVGYDTLKSRNVSLTRGLNVDQNLNDLMGSVMVDIISQNGKDSSKTLDEAVRSFSKGGTNCDNRGTKKKVSGKLKGKVEDNTSLGAGDASTTLKKLLGVNLQPSDVSMANNGDLSVVEMLQRARKKAPAQKGDSKNSANWQQEQLLQMQSNTSTSANTGLQPQGGTTTGGKHAKGKGGSSSYTKEQTKQLSKFMKKTAGGKDVNYASSAVFNAPDASEIPLPDFAADMASATFAKGGFFDT